VWSKQGIKGMMAIKIDLEKAYDNQMVSLFGKT